MRFIIIGAGDVGTSLSVKLATYVHDVVLIEKDAANIGPEIGALDLQVIIGNGASPEVLESAGIEQADYIIAVTDIDEVNIAACFISRLVNPKPKRIARVRDIDLAYATVPGGLLAEYFDLIINPEQAGAEYMLQLFRLPGAREIVEFAGGMARVIGLEIQPNSPLDKLRLNQLREWEEELPLLVVGVMRDGRLLIPRGDDKLRGGDIVYAITIPEKTKLLFELCGRELHEGRSAIIWGGTGLARSVARSLENACSSLKIIVSDRDVQDKLADELQKTLILHGEGTDQDLLVQENIANVDAFIAATPDEEDNVLAALLAKRLGARTVMALVNKSTYLSLVSAVGVDVVLSSRLAAASAIFRHIHSHALITEVSLQHESGGFIETQVRADSDISDKPVKDLKLPHGILLCLIQRGDKVIIPGGNDVLLEGDRIVIFVMKSALKKLEKLLRIKLELLA